MVVAYERHGGTINDLFIDRFESLMLSHIFIHLLASPRRIVCDDGPVVIILARTSNV